MATFKIKFRMGRHKVPLTFYPFLNDFFLKDIKPSTRSELYQNEFRDFRVNFAEI